MHFKNPISRLRTKLPGSGNVALPRFAAASFASLALFAGLLSALETGAGPSETGSAAKAAARDQPTPLESYISSPDPNYSWTIESLTEEDGYRTAVIRMTSQAWLTEAEVDRPVWWHWLVVVVPDQVKNNKAMLYIGGGDNDDGAPTSPNPLILQTALATESVAAELRMVPNQPLSFVGDDFGPRSEDALIAYGWKKFLRGGARDHDALWLARLPMTKAAVRAIDTLESALAGSELTSTIVPEQWIVAGGSKRGWTTWTTAIVDARVVAIVPFVIDMLNVVPSFAHHWRVYGFWAPAVADYKREGIMDWSFRPEYARLMEITEPYSYRERLTLPKYLVNAAGDEFFLPDSWQFYWRDLAGEKHLRYVPNASHSLAGTDVAESFLAFYRAILEDFPRPDFDWSFAGNELVVQTKPGQKPTAVKLWRASNPTRRDFRVVTIRDGWQSEDIALRADGRYQISVPEPESGWTAFFVELTYAGAGPEPFKFTTGVKVVPEVEPFGPYQPDPSVWQSQP